jgi:hypothetical protein
MTRDHWDTGPVWLADDFAAWLVAQLADAGRRKLTGLVLGDEFDRALGRAATAAITATARDLRGDDAAEAEFLAAALSEIFAAPVPAARGRGTVLEALQAGIAAQLAVLDDPGLTGSGRSAAAELGVSSGAAAPGLTGHLLNEIVSRAARGGPLFPLAAQLSADLARLQSQQTQQMLRELGAEILEAITGLGVQSGLAYPSLPPALEAAGREEDESVPPGAVRVREASWRQLGVHRPIEADGADPDGLPAYVPRDMDLLPRVGLRDRLIAAAEHGGLVVLVGKSSTGKTRSLVEAVQALLGGWWLIQPWVRAAGGAQPASPAAVTVLAKLAAAPPPRLVVWLGDLLNYADAGGLQAATANQLISGGAVLVGTMWPGAYDQLIRPPAAAFDVGTSDELHQDPGGSHWDCGDPHRDGRELLKLATVIRMPAAPSDAENDRARDLAENACEGVGDPRLRAALKVSEYGFTQAIAAAPQLVDQWHNADPYASAVLAAAVDASRMGARAPLTRQFLRAAAPGYCDSAERARAPADWFNRALSYACQVLLGAASALIPVSSGDNMSVAAGYRPADYLVQHTEAERQPYCPPAAFWKAAVAGITDQADLERLGMSASSRMRYRYAIPLLLRSDTRGSYPAMRLLGLLWDQGHVDTAVPLLRRELEDENPDAMLRFGRMRPDFIDTVRASAVASSPSPDNRASLLRGHAGSRGFRAATEPSQIEAQATELFGDVEKLRHAYQADSSDLNSAARLVHFLACTGRFTEMLPILHALVDRGETWAEPNLIATLAEMGRWKDSFNLARFGLTADGSIETRPATGQYLRSKH